MDLEHDTLPPLPRMRSPSSPKRVRRRPPFKNSTIVSSTVVSSPRPADVISTLIDSLTAISDSAREELRREFDTRPQDLHVDYHRPSTSDSFVPEHHRAAYDPISDGELNSDGEIAEAPVIRFARSPPIVKKKPHKTSTSLYSQSMLSEHSLTGKRSRQSLRAGAESVEWDTPSIEMPNPLSTSLSDSIISGRRSPRNISTPEPAGDQSTAQPVLPWHQSSHPRTVENTTPERSLDDEKENQTPGPSPDLEDSFAPDNPLDPPASDGPNISALNPLNRGDLKQHLIPFRRSSMRRSANSSGDSGDSRRQSMGSRDLKELNIDSDLIDSDDSTIRRIRELQEAREKRQNEWLKEAKKSDKSPKRHSVPSPKALQRSSTYQGSKLSVTEVLVETPEHDGPHLSACVTGTDLADMPAVFNPSPTTPTPPPMDAARNSYLSTSTNPRSISPPRSSRPTSVHVKRSSMSYSVRHDTTANDVKTIADEVEAALGAPRLTQRLRHPRTGRAIAFSEVGDPNGFVVFCCVGMGLTRYVTAFYDELARTLKLRLITPDRPGVGESEAVPERLGNPLTWVDDVAVICDALDITRFSLLAHSAGAIYALATALKMPQFVRGRIHLLAPWIPPSQMPKGAAIGPDSQPIANLPLAHRILSVLPAPILKVANSRFLSATSASVETKPLRNKKLRNLENLESSFAQSYNDLSDPSLSGVLNNRNHTHTFENDPPTPNSTRARSISCYQATTDSLTLNVNGLLPSPTSLNHAESRLSSATSRHGVSPSPRPQSPRMTAEARQKLYNTALTHRIWSLATHNANPAIDLLICLERRKPIGFRYAEVTRSVVIHHGAKDSRVPLDNARWLQGVMKRCELRVLEGEGHSLMASAAVMSAVLGEMGREWEEWGRIARDKERRKAENGVLANANEGGERGSLRSYTSASMRS